MRKHQNVGLRGIMFILVMFTAFAHSAPVTYWQFENSGVIQYNSPALDLTLGVGAEI